MAKHSMGERVGQSGAGRHRAYRQITKFRAFVGLSAVAGLLLVGSFGALAGGAGAAVPGPARVPATPANAAKAKPPVFAYYYLWWSTDHWRSALGPHYPLSAAPRPLPARLDATGCHPKTNYAGNTLTDVPQTLYDQDTPGVIEADVRQAAAAGLTGFAVNWVGTGTSGQNSKSVIYSSRLQALVDAVHKVNAQGIPFKLWLSYKASAATLSLSHIDHDFGYLLGKYGKDPAFDRSLSPKLTIIWQGSRKYSVSALQAMSKKYRSAARILGDEKQWSNTRAPYLDGDAYYWSSQNPYANPQSFAQLAALARQVRASGRNLDGTAKVWVAPFTPGYDKELAHGSSCVPRKGGQTLKVLFTGNAGTHPDAFGLISWNEVTEGTYIDPMTRYAGQSLAVLKALR